MLNLMTTLKKNHMPKYFCSYAYDIPCYADFYVEAENVTEAEKLIRQELESGAFSAVNGIPFWEGAGGNDRVFVSGKVTDDNDPGASLDELLSDLQVRKETP